MRGYGGLFVGGLGVIYNGLKRRAYRDASGIVGGLRRAVARGLTWGSKRSYRNTPLLRVVVEPDTGNLRTKILDFRGLDSSIILTLRGGIPRPRGKLPERKQSAHLSRDNPSREIGRSRHQMTCQSKALQLNATHSARILPGVAFVSLSEVLAATLSQVQIQTVSMMIVCLCDDVWSSQWLELKARKLEPNSRIEVHA